MEKIQITERIFYWKASNEPLSSDVITVQGDKAFWIFDVGNNPEVAKEIQTLPGEKNIILSHFHEDHIGNLEQIEFHQLYQGSHTKKYTNQGMTVKGDLYLEDGVRLHLFELPSSHAKGSIALEVDETYAFLGDGTYSRMYKGRVAYNTQLLLAELRTLKSIQAPYVLLSHEDPLIHKKEEVIAELTEIYQKHEKNEAYIYLEE